MKKRNMIVTGSLAATLLLTGSKATLADTTVIPKTTSRSSTEQTFSLSSSEIQQSLSTVAEQLGINADDFREELRQGVRPKQVLENQGFSSSQIQKIFKTPKATHSNFESEE